MENYKDQLAPKHKLSVIRYGFPEDLNEEQNEILKVMVLNRIESVIKGHNFDRNTFALVMHYTTIPSWDESNMAQESFYQNEREMIDGMFSDIEDDPAYRSTIGELSRCCGNHFQIELITEREIYLTTWNQLTP